MYMKVAQNKVAMRLPYTSRPRHVRIENHSYSSLLPAVSPRKRKCQRSFSREMDDRLPTVLQQ
jgi:hypothetical protein